LFNWSTSNVRLGVGIAAPVATLHVRGGNSNNAIVDNDGSQYTTMSWYNNGTLKAQGYFDANNILFVLGTDVVAPFVFKANGTEGMRLSSGGGVSIGTSTSAGAGNLLVNGTVTASSFVGVTPSVPSGSVMLFYQAAAPTGWTQVTTLNDYDLRLVSGAGGSTGGTTAYSTVFTNQTPTISVSVSGSVGSTTLSTSQMPSHSHQEYSILFFYTNDPSNSPTDGVSRSSIYNSCGTNYYPYGSTPTFNYTGGAGSDGSHNHSFSGSGSGTSSAVTLNVRYANIIICSKN
jgi:hypothetical protein